MHFYRQEINAFGLLTGIENDVKFNNSQKEIGNFRTGESISLFSTLQKKF